MTLSIVLYAVLLASAAAGPVPAQQQGGGLGGVLDTLGGLLGGGTPQKIRGTVVLAQDSTLVVRGDDKRTYRIDTASIDPGVRRGLATGQTVSVSVAGGGGQGVLTATELTPQGVAPAQAPFNHVSGAVQESSAGRAVFKMNEGLMLDVSQIHGLPYLAANQPATLYYEQGPRQENVGVWIEPGGAQPSVSPAASAREERVRGLVESFGVGSMRLQKASGEALDVDTATVDSRTLEAVRPGDIVTVTGTERDGRFVARSIQTENTPAR